MTARSRRRCRDSHGCWKFILYRRYSRKTNRDNNRDTNVGGWKLLPAAISSTPGTGQVSTIANLRVLITTRAQSKCLHCGNAMIYIDIEKSEDWCCAVCDIIVSGDRFHCEQCCTDICEGCHKASIDEDVD